MLIIIAGEHPNIKNSKKGEKCKLGYKINIKMKLN